MLKISVHEGSSKVVFQLEGRLAGAWVAELEERWREAVPRLAGQTVQLDLDRVQLVDNAGKYLLALLRFRGVQLTCSALEIQGLVQSICAEWPVNADIYAEKTTKLISSPGSI
jgi:ABC-type transporter Mla MlaB component